MSSRLNYEKANRNRKVVETIPPKENHIQLTTTDRNSTKIKLVGDYNTKEALSLIAAHLIKLGYNQIRNATIYFNPEANSTYDPKRNPANWKPAKTAPRKYDNYLREKQKKQIEQETAF